MKKNCLVVFLLHLMLIGSTCDGDETAQTLSADEVKVKVVDSRGLDGCTFLLETSDGKRLEPLNLEEVHKKAGTTLAIKYKKETASFGICMAGERVTITSSRVLKGKS